MADSKEAAATDLAEFAAAVAHEIRTPLAAVAGEVEIALRRDRSAAEYRDALQRIAAGISELVEISGDLTLLSHPADESQAPSSSARLDVVLSRIRDRYDRRDDVAIALDGAAGVHVAGDEARLVRAITLVVEHAIRHRKGQAPVSVCAVTTGQGGLRLVVGAQPSGFWPKAWSPLRGHAPVPLRLRTARRILEAHGGALLAASESGTDAAHIDLGASV